MKMYKSLISLILIFAYSIGFAHSFVPHNTELHCDHGSKVVEHYGNHHAHEDGERVSEDHSHIAHADHYDESFLDLIACALENVNHNKGSCNLDFYTPNPEFNLSEIVIEKLSLDGECGLQVTNTTVDLPSIKLDYSDAQNHRGIEGFNIGYSYRGPPNYTL